jgi:hypothetical protein
MADLLPAPLKIKQCGGIHTFHVIIRETGDIFYVSATECLENLSLYWTIINRNSCINQFLPLEELGTIAVRSRECNFVLPVCKCDLFKYSFVNRCTYNFIWSVCFLYFHLHYVNVLFVYFNKDFTYLHAYLLDAPPQCWSVSSSFLTPTSGNTNY